MRKLLAFFVILCTVGCHKKVPVHPGAISNLDSYAYDILLVEQQIILEARAQYAAGNLPAQAKDALKAAIAQYNIAQSAWHGYHDQHSGNDSALQDAINALIGAVSQLQQSLGKTPAPMPTSPISWIPAFGGVA